MADTGANRALSDLIPGNELAAQGGTERPKTVQLAKMREVAASHGRGNIAIRLGGSAAALLAAREAASAASTPPKSQETPVELQLLDTPANDVAATAPAAVESAAPAPDLIEEVGDEEGEDVDLEGLDVDMGITAEALKAPTAKPVEAQAQPAENEPHAPTLKVGPRLTDGSDIKDEYTEVRASNPQGILLSFINQQGSETLGVVAGYGGNGTYAYVEINFNVDDNLKPEQVPLSDFVKLSKRPLKTGLLNEKRIKEALGVPTGLNAIASRIRRAIGRTGPSEVVVDLES